MFNVVKHPQNILVPAPSNIIANVNNYALTSLSWTLGKGKSSTLDMDMDMGHC